jgi:hypothetical protein
MNRLVRKKVGRCRGGFFAPGPIVPYGDRPTACRLISRMRHEYGRLRYGEVQRIGRGIVLAHDSFEDETHNAADRTQELTARRVPILKVKSYRFVGLDAVFSQKGIAKPIVAGQETIAVAAATVT